MRYILLASFAFCGLAPLLSFAHPGGIDANGGHYCRTNCTSWGEVYGAWHSHSGGSSYTSPSYSYTPPAPTYTTNNDCPSYGFAYLGSCYELPDNARKSAFSGFTCNYGYEEVGYGLSKRCLKEIENGYRIGDSVRCDYGYELSYGLCIRKSTDNSYPYGALNFGAALNNEYSESSCPKNSTEKLGDRSKCVCNTGYTTNGDGTACKKISKKTNERICRAEFGKNSTWSGKYDTTTKTPTCQCKKGFLWDAEQTSCVKR
jgi:hypothetical protein